MSPRKRKHPAKPRPFDGAAALSAIEAVKAFPALHMVALWSLITVAALFLIRAMEDV